MRLALIYAVLALIATVANIGAQELVVRVYMGNFAILISVAVGTGVGLVVKYVLDKRYIFRFCARSTAHDVQVFALYSMMGLTTTVIFWGGEFFFHYVFETKEMRYLGGVIGLTFGYLTKYYLDKRYVFSKEGV